MDAGIGETMAISALIGAGVGGASSAAQGGDPLKGALMGGALGAVTGGFAGGAGGAAGSAVADSTTLVPGAVAGAGTGAVGAGTGTALTDAALGSGSGFGLTGASTGIGIGAGNGAVGGLAAPTAGISSLGLPAAATGTLGAGATTGAAASGLGGAFGTGLSNMGLAADVGGGYLAGTIGAPIKGAQNPNATPYTGPLTQLHYSPGSFTPSTPSYAPNSVYVPHYAEGGVTQISPANVNFMAGGAYPMSQQNTPQFNTPSQMPVGAQNAQMDGNEPETNPLTGEPTKMMASGGIAGLLKGRGDGMSDDIHATIGGSQPARLADGEFVVPADVVSHLGNGSTDAGAKHLYKMMDKVRHARTGRKAQGKQIKAGGYLPA